MAWFSLPAERTRVPDEFHDLIRRAYRTRKTRARIIVDDCLGAPPALPPPAPTPCAPKCWRNVLHHLALVYRVTLETGRSLTDDDLEPSRKLARLRASQDVPLGEFLTFFLVGLTVVWDHLIGARRRESGVASPAARSRGSDHLQPDAAHDRPHRGLRRGARAPVPISRAGRRRLLSAPALRGCDGERARSARSIARDSPRRVAHGRHLRSGHFGLGAKAPASDPATSGATWRLACRRAETWVGRYREGFVGLLAEDPDPDALAAAAEGFSATERARRPRRRRTARSPGCDRSAREAVRAFRIGAIRAPAAAGPPLRRRRGARSRRRRLSHGRRLRAPRARFPVATPRREEDLPRDAAPALPRTAIASSSRRRPSPSIPTRSRIASSRSAGALVIDLAGRRGPPARAPRAADPRCPSLCLPRPPPRRRAPS